MNNKQKLYLEYPLNTKSAQLVWELISSDHGLERWIADRVSEDNGILSFTWGDPWGEHHSLAANIVEREKNSHLKLQWVDEDTPEAYWEIRMGRSDMTDQICLYVTDYAQQDDLDDLTTLWEGNMERLHAATGF